MTWFSLPVRRSLVPFIGAAVGVFAVLPHPGRHLGELAAYVVIAGAAVGVGTWLAASTALQSPILDAVLTRRPLPPRTLSSMAQAAGFGAVTVLVVAADSLLIRSMAGGVWLQRPPVWTGLLYALAGGLSEEVVFHYGLLVAIARIALRLMSPGAAYWLAIAVSAVALGLSHLRPRRCCR